MADTITLNAGTSADAVEDLQSVQDGLIYHIVEEAATPGIDLIVDFVDVERFDYVQVVGYYEGSRTHSVSIQLYCWESTAWHTWESHDGIEETMRNHSFFIPCGSIYIGTNGNAGKVRVRLNHTQGGNPSHDIYIDVVALYDREAGLQAQIDALKATLNVSKNVYDETPTPTGGAGSSPGGSPAGGGGSVSGGDSGCS